MTTSKFSKYPKPSKQLVKGNQLVSPPQPTSTQTDPDQWDGIRYAQSVEGMLSRRSPDALRRYILSPQSFDEQERRQNVLFEKASRALSMEPSEKVLPECTFSTTHIGKPGNVVTAGLYAMPVVFSTSRELYFYSRMRLDRSSAQSVSKAIEQTILKSCPKGLISVRLEALISVEDLAGISPLTLQTAVCNEVRRNLGDFQASVPQIPSDISRPTRDGWRQICHKS